MSAPITTLTAFATSEEPTEERAGERVLLAIEPTVALALTSATGRLDPPRHRGCPSGPTRGALRERLRGRPVCVVALSYGVACEKCTA